MLEGTYPHGVVEKLALLLVRLPRCGAYLLYGLVEDGGDLRDAYLAHLELGDLVLEVPVEQRVELPFHSGTEAASGDGQ